MSEKEHIPTSRHNAMRVAREELPEGATGEAVPLGKNQFQSKKILSTMWVMDRRNFSYDCQSHSKRACHDPVFI